MVAVPFTRTVLDDVAQVVDAVVAGPIGNRQRAFVQDAHEARRVALGRGVRAARPHRRQHDERRGLDEGAVILVQVVDLFADGALGRLAVDGFGLGDSRQRVCRHGDG
jgi:hypothetical protein